MTNYRAVLSVAVLSLAIAACGGHASREAGEVTKREGQPDVIQVDGEDLEMNQAMEEARKAIGQFVVELSRDDAAASLSLKARFEEGGATEHIWLTNVIAKRDGFSGEINNEPLDIRNVRLGQRVWVPMERVSDWLVIRDGMLRGGYTIRVLRARMSPEEQKELDESMNATFEPLEPAV